MTPAFQEGKAAALIGATAINPYRRFIAQQAAHGRDAERELPRVFEFARDWDSGFVSVHRAG